MGRETTREHAVMALRRLLVALALTTALPACGMLPGGEPASQPRSDHAAEQLSAFRERLGALEDALAAQTGQAKESRRAAARLDGALDALRRRLQRMAGSNAAARAAAADALSEVQAAARDVALLTERYDFHMRRYHGGP